MSWATDFASAHADDYSGSKIKAPTIGSPLQKGYSKVFKSYAGDVPTLSGSYKKPKMSAAGYLSAQSLTPYLGGTATAVSALSSKERSIPERVDPMKELGRLTADPLKASNDLAASGLTTALGVLGTGPSFTLERPLATAGAVAELLGVDPGAPHRMLDTELRQSLGPVYGTASDIVGGIGNLVAGMIGFGGEVLTNVQTAIPALYNSSDAQNAARVLNADRNSKMKYEGISGDLPTNILGFLASIIPTSPSNPANIMLRPEQTVGEFLSDLEARGFTREEIEKVANGKMSPFDFGSKAMSQNEAAEIIARVAMDPTIILLAPGVPSLIAGSAARVGMTGAQILRLGDEAAQVVNFGKKSTTLASVLGATKAAAKTYRKIAIGTTAVEVGLRGTELGLDSFAPAWRDSKVDPVYNAFLKPLFELNNAAISNRPLSDKPLIAVWAAFKTPIHQSFSAVGEASHKVFTKAFGGEFTEPVFREITSNLSKAEILKRYDEMGLTGAKTFAAKRAAVATEMMGGDMGVANVLSHFLATVVWDKMPQNVKENLAQGIGGIDEAAIKASVIHMMVTDILKSQALEGKVRVSPGEVVAAMRRHFQEGNVSESLVNNRWDGDLFVQQWDQFEKVVTPITEAMHASLAESFGTSRNNLPNVTLREVLPKEFIDVLSNRLKATAKGDRISLDVIREELATRYPVLERMDPDFWGAMKLDSAQAPTLKEVQAKLKLYRKSAPSLHDFYKNDAAAEAAARSSAGVELTAPLHDVPMDGIPTSTARFTASNYNADMGVARSVTEAGEMHAHPAVDLFEIGAPRAMAEAGFPIQRATRTESVVNGRAVPSVSITVAGDSIFDFRRPAAAVGRTAKADYVEITIRGDDLGRVVDEKGKPIQPNGFVVSWDVAGKTAAELDVISESLRQAGVSEFEVIRSDSLIEVKMTAAEAKSLMDKVDAADEALTGQGVPVYEVQKAYVERVHRTKALADSGPTYRTVLDAAKSDRRVAGWTLASRRNLTPGPAGGVASFHDGPNGSVLREANHDPRVRVDRLQSPAATEGIGYGDTFKFRGPPTKDGDYAYHVTAPDNVYGIYGRGQIDPVRADTPVRGSVTGRAKWVDGTNKGRTYWNRDPKVAAAGASGQGAVIAVRTDAPKIDGLFSQEAGSDHLISERPIKSEELWVLGGDGQWYPMDGFHGGRMDFDPNNSAAQVQKKAHAAVPKQTGLAPVQELQTQYITNVATKHGVDAATGTHGIRLSKGHDAVGITTRLKDAYKALTTSEADVKQANTLRARLKGYMAEDGVTIKPGMEGRAQRTQKQLENLIAKKPGLRSSKATAKLEIELGDQLDHAIEAGYTFERWDQAGEPYPTVDAMLADVRDNKHLYYAPDDTGAQLRDGISVSEALSALHDLYGYAATGFDRTPEGSVNALLAHGRMFSPEARKALTAEWARRQSAGDINHGVSSAGMSARVQALQQRVENKKAIHEHVRRNFPSLTDEQVIDVGDVLNIVAERWAYVTRNPASDWLNAWYISVTDDVRKMTPEELLGDKGVFPQSAALVKEDIMARAGDSEYATLHAELAQNTRWNPALNGGRGGNEYIPGTEARNLEIVNRMRDLMERDYAKGPPQWFRDAADRVHESWADFHVPERVDAGPAGSLYIPGGPKALDDPNFRFSLWDVHVLRSQAIDAAHLMSSNPMLSVKLYRKLFQSLERDLSDPMETLNLTMFALLSPKLDFHINEAKFYLIRPRNIEDVRALAKYVEHLPIGEDGNRRAPVSVKGEIGRQIHSDYGIGTAAGVHANVFGMYGPYFQVASAADRFLRGEAEGNNIFRKPQGMSNETLAERLMNSIDGAGPKVGTFSPMLGGPLSGTRGTIDIHMMRFLNNFIETHADELAQLDPPAGAAADFWTRPFNDASALKVTSQKVYDTSGQPFEHLRDLEDVAKGKTMKGKSVETISSGEYDRANQLLQKAKDADEVMLREIDPTFSWEDYFGLGGYQWWRWDVQRNGIMEPHVNVYPYAYKMGRIDPTAVGEALNFSQRYGRSNVEQQGAGLPLTPFDPWEVAFAQTGRIGNGKAAKVLYKGFTQYVRGFEERTKNRDKWVAYVDDQGNHYAYYDKNQTEAVPLMGDTTMRQMSWGLEAADVTTVIHEMLGHMGRDHYREIIDDYGSMVFMDGYLAGVAKELDIPGANGHGRQYATSGKWSAKQNEAFAQLMEDYLLKGKAPTPHVERILAKVKDYFAQVYHAVKSLVPDLPYRAAQKTAKGEVYKRQPGPYASITAQLDEIFQGSKDTTTYWEDVANLEKAMKEEGMAAPAAPERKLGLLPDEINQHIDDLIDDPSNAEYGTSSPDIMTTRTEGDMRSTFAAADPDLVTWSAERDFYTHHLVPGINSGFFNGKGDLYRAVVSQWDRMLLNEAPMYTVLKPSPNIFRRYDSQLAGKLSEDQAAAAYYLAGRTSLGRLLLDYGPMGKVTAATRWLLRPVPGSALNQAAQQALIDEFNGLGIRPSDTVKALRALREEATRHKIHDIPIYRGPENMFSGTIANTIRDAIGDRIPDGVTNRDLVSAFDRSSNRFMRYADQRMAKAGTMEKGFLGAADYAYRMFQGEKGYGKSLWGKMGGGTRVVSKTFYHWYRFLMDPRWWAMNLMERDAFSYLRNGEKAVRPTHLDIERSTAFQMHAGMTDVTHLDTRMMDPGFESMRNYTAAIAKNFDVERPDLTAALVKRVIAEDPVHAGGLYRMFGEGKTVDQYVAELDSWLYTFNEKGAGVIVDEAARMAEQMRIPPGTAEHKMFMEFADRIYQEHHSLYENLKNTFQGRGDRTSLERMLNSYWLYWPLSYQLKAGKWMVDLLTKRAVGYNTNLGGAAYLNLIVQHHQDLMESDVTYRKAFEEHPAMWGFAGMMLPATPWDWGVSLSRPTRYAAGWLSSETDTGIVGEYRATKDPLTMMMSIGQMGPTYTFGVPLGGGAWRGPVPDMAKEFGIPGPWTNASY